MMMPMKTESMSGRDDGVATDGQLPPSPSTPTNPLCSHLVTRYGSSSDSSRRRGTLYEINLFKLFKTHSKRLLPWQKICINVMNKQILSRKSLTLNNASTPTTTVTTTTTTTRKIDERVFKNNKSQTTNATSTLAANSCSTGNKKVAITRLDLSCKLREKKTRKPRSDSGLKNMLLSGIVEPSATLTTTTPTAVDSSSSSSSAAAAAATRHQST